MSRIFKDRLSTGVTPVADAFIDNYMAAANGEYVKVYLYILRHQNQEDLTLEQIARCPKPYRSRCKKSH